MGRSSRCLVSLAIALAAVTARVEAQGDRDRFLAEVDDAIDRANGREPPPHPLRPVVHEETWSGMATVSSVFLRFFGGLAPNSTGVERPNPDEHPIDEYEVRLGDRTSYVLMGAANDHVLTPLHFYQQFDGLHSFRYDLTRRQDGSPFRVSLGGSPAYGSVTVITRHMGVQEDEQLPASVVIGGAGGLDAWYLQPLIEIHGAAWALPGADVLNGGASGAELIQSLQLKWRLTEVFHWDHTWPIDFGLRALHVDRGEARSAIYQWNGDFRSPAELREVWQLLAIVELRVN